MAVYSEKYRYVFNFAPKTATRSVRLFLERYYDAELHKSHHARLHILGFHHCALVRNPYFRMISFWQFRVQNIPHKTAKSFSEFLKNTKKFRPRYWSQTKFYGDLLDFVIHFESLDKDMSDLPFINKPIHIPTMDEWWKTDNPFFTSELTGAQRRKQLPMGMFNRVYSNKRNVQALMDHSGEDFEKFGYSTEVPYVEKF